MSDEISFDKNEIKKYFTKNNYNLVFSILALVSLIFFIIGVSNINFLVQITGLISNGMWFLLFISFAGSSILAYYEKYELMVLPVLIWLLIFTVQVRTVNVPQLIDVSTGNYTLGPDLDPFLYLRDAYAIEAGSVPKIDLMRYAPIGAPNYARSNLMPWAIVGLHKLISIFHSVSIEYAAIILPVILFAISIIGFFLFTRLIFSSSLGRKKSSIVALIASFFYATAPAMLHRTTGGIPEIESLGMAFFWFAFLFFTLAWKSESKKKWIVLGIISGIFTGLMSLSWGGYRYIYMILSVVALVIFLFDKNHKKNLIIFSSWLIPALILEVVRAKVFLSVAKNISGPGIAIGILVLLGAHKLISYLKIKKLKKINLPESIKTIIILALVGLVFLFIVNPKSLLSLVSKIVEGLLFPFGKSRVGLTVAENKAPYFNEALQQFGYILWMFLLSIVLIFYEAVKHFKKEHRNLLTFSFILFIAGITFSRISEASMFNGENFISTLAFFAGLGFFVISFLTIYIKGHRNKNHSVLENFRNINFSYLFLIAFSFWALISMRGAIRLFFLVSPMIILVASYLPLKLFGIVKKTKDSLLKTVVVILIIVTVIALIISFVGYTSSTKYQAAATVPGIYEQQWQLAMSWVRDNTLENSVFVHWWDYGYWVQTLGERATVSDGGHYVGYWDHLVGRYVMTSTNPEATLSFMKAHDVSYLLIDSTDLGKYSAYSKIGSDENWDRFSFIPVGQDDPSQTVEKNSSMTKLYRFGGVVDEDIEYDGNFLPGPVYDKYGSPGFKAYLGGMTVEISDSDGGKVIRQPNAIYIYNNKQFEIPLRYVYFNGDLYDFKDGIDAVIILVPAISQSSSGGVNLDVMGGAIYLSPKVSQGLFARTYLLSNAFGDYNSLDLAHSQEDVIVKSLKEQGAINPVNDFVLYQGSVRGPIKIWNVEYPENIIARDEFLNISGEYAEYDNIDFVK